MKILALEFSTDQRSVALVEADPGGRVLYAGEVVRSGGRATPALAMIEEALAQAGVEREAVDCLAVGCGPGSYTGVRMAVALAQGWQIARGIRLLGLSSVEGVVAQAAADGILGPVSVVVDAQREELYLAGFQIGAGGWRETAPLSLASLNEAQDRRSAGDLLIGPEATRWFPDGRAILPRAETLGRLALGRDDFVTGEKLTPIYLRETSFIKAPPARSIS